MQELVKALFLLRRVINRGRRAMVIDSALTRERPSCHSKTFKFLSYTQTRDISKIWISGWSAQGMYTEKTNDRGRSPALSTRRAGRERDIVSSAKRLFAEKGFEATAVSDIAREVGIVEGTIYTYFDSKRALLHRVICEFYEPLIAEVESSIRGITGVRNRLRYLVWRQLRLFAEEPELCYLIIRELQPATDAYDSIVVGQARRYTSIAVQVLKEGIESGEVRNDVSPYLVRAAIYGTVENVAWRLTFRKKAIDIEALANEVADILCNGILQRPAVQPMSEAVASLETLVRELRADMLLQSAHGANRPKRRKLK